MSRPSEIIPAMIAEQRDAIKRWKSELAAPNSDAYYDLTDRIAAAEEEIAAEEATARGVRL